MKLHVGLILLHSAASVVHGGVVDEAADQLQVLSSGSRHRLSEHRKKQTQLLSSAEVESIQGSEIPRNLARIHKKKNKKYKDDADDAKKMKKDEKKKKKVKKVISKSSDKKTANGNWNTDDDCNCDDWTGDSWSGDSWIGDYGLPIGWNEDGWDDNEHYKDILANLRADIIQLIHETERDLLPQCLRLAFHDCIDGCDGCIDPDELDNRGLEEPVELLFPLVKQYNGYLSRADLWSYCAIVAADMAVVDNRPDDLRFYMNYIGRKDCKGADEKGFGGPEVSMPGSDLTTHEITEFFYKGFGFDSYETVVLMGVHSAGVLHRENLGFGNVDKEDGWIEHADLYKLSNLYYTSMLSNVWEMEKVENEGSAPPRYQWYFGGEGDGPIMLTADMSLILDFEGYIVTDSKGVDGKILCLAHPEADFEVREEGDPDHIKLCPMAKETREYVEELKEDNNQFLFAFVVVLNKMIANGYGHELPMGKSGKKSKGSKSSKGKKRNLKKDRGDDDTDTEAYLPLDAVETVTTVQLNENEGTKSARSSGPKKRCSCQ